MISYIYYQHCQYLCSNEFSPLYRYQNKCLLFGFIIVCFSTRNKSYWKIMDIKEKGFLKSFFSRFQATHQLTLLVFRCHFTFLIFFSNFKWLFFWFSMILSVPSSTIWKKDFLNYLKKMKKKSYKLYLNQKENLEKYEKKI